eukprot:1144920-Amphidinium_carterae.3
MFINLLVLGNFGGGGGGAIFGSETDLFSELSKIIGHRKHHNPKSPSAFAQSGDRPGTLLATIQVLGRYVQLCRVCLFECTHPQPKMTLTCDGETDHGCVTC